MHADFVVGSDGIVDSWTNITQTSSASTPDELKFFDGSYASADALYDLTDEVWFGDEAVANAFADALVTDLNAYSGSPALEVVDHPFYSFVWNVSNISDQVDAVFIYYKPYQGYEYWQKHSASWQWDVDAETRLDSWQYPRNLVHLYTESSSSGGGSSPTVPEPRWH